jgi:uncharacterized protein (TIGR04255 family)
MVLRLDRKLPDRLEKEPLQEALWEVRFAPTQPASAEILTGLAFARMKGPLGLETAVPQPASAIPPELREAQEYLRYAPVTHLRGSRFSISVGPRSLAFSSLKPYCGWKQFRGTILELVDLLERSGVVGTFERFGLRYLDILANLEPISLALLNVTLRVGNITLGEQPVALQFEERSDRYIHIVQIASPVNFAVQGQSRGRGLSVSTDTVAMAPSGATLTEFVSSNLDAVHAENKHMFFAMLTPETEKSLGPVYDQRT